MSLEKVPSSAASAKNLGVPRYYTGRPCKNGHVDERYACSRSCVSCDKIRCQGHYKNNREYIKRYKDTYRDEKKEERRAWARDHYKKNRDKILAYNKKWQKENRARRNKSATDRRSAELQRTPFWADRVGILKFYNLAELFTTETGITHHVDHIYPLQGETVSGLHVPENLQVVTATHNAKKRNMHPDEFYGRIDSGFTESALADNTPCSNLRRP